jgi:ATP phosphoribosyltransferase regulatory subunit
LKFDKAAMLEMFSVEGYKLLMLSLIEYIHFLAIEEGTPFNLKTFKVPDHSFGQKEGLRAEIISQVSRINAHLLDERHAVTRLCDAGSVVYTRPEGFARFL